MNTDEDPSGWRPYYTFVDHLREKYAKNEVLQGMSESPLSFKYTDGLLDRIVQFF